MKAVVHVKKYGNNLNLVSFQVCSRQPVIDSLWEDEKDIKLGFPV